MTVKQIDSCSPRNFMKVATKKRIKTERNSHIYDLSWSLLRVGHLRICRFQLVLMRRAGARYIGIRQTFLVGLYTIKELISAALQ